MADGKKSNVNKKNKKKQTIAEIILDTDREILARLEALEAAVSLPRESGESDGESTREHDAEYSARQISEVYTSLSGELQNLKRDLDYLSAQNESIFNEFSRRMSEIFALLQGQPYSYQPYDNRYAAQSMDYARSQPPVPAPAPKPVQAEIDYDKLAEKIVSVLPTQEFISPDYIACKVAEQIVLPEGGEYSQKSSRSTPAEKEPQYIAAPVDVQLNEDELADNIAIKVGAIKAEDFDILVDDDGCASIAKDIAEKLNYDVLAAEVAEKLRPALEMYANAAPDYDDMATRISEKITVAGINEESIADKAAAALSNYMPEIDTDEIADKVVTQILTGVTFPELDGETITKNISDKLIEFQETHDYDIVIDEEGLNKLSDYVTGEVKQENDKRFDVVDKEIAEVKALIIAGAVVGVAANDSNDEDLVTVSDVVDDGNEQLSIEDVEKDEELEELVEDIDETPSDAEKMPDGLDEGAVDFEHMMKYNRSFIARIIQSPDEYKQYYGQVKTALLSYSKVNSSLAWGAERFNKGRETIARFKIRGKTLCLYLALDPNAYEYSVYHHADVSDNKSMHGTPMMVKIKSPRGAKKAIRLIDEMLTERGAVKRNRVIERNYAEMYPFESMDELIEDGLVKDVSNGK